MAILRTFFLPMIMFLLVSPVVAQQSGVLLGTLVTPAQNDDGNEGFASIHEPAYQTLWIARDTSGELKVLASFADLIVPRNDGFWRAGVKQLCEFADNNESLRQVVWAAPVTKAATWSIVRPAPRTNLQTMLHRLADRTKIKTEGEG